jgi:transcriptional regulator with XRE-family HTH domain
VTNERAAEFDVDALAAALDAERRARGLTWAQLGRAIGEVSASTLSGLRERGTVEGDGVLQMLRWLGRTPESFLRGAASASEARDDAALPAAPPSGVLRFDARAIHDALEARRAERGMTWQQVAAASGVGSAATLTRLREGGRVAFPQVMRVFAWLGQPAARFVRVARR